MSDEADHYALKVEMVESRRHFDNLHNWISENSHDWDKPKKQTKQGKDVCCWLIHSLIFEFAFYDDGQSVEGFFVSSDLDSDKCLYHVTLNDWLNYVGFISSDDVSELHAERTEKGIKYKKVRNKNLY